MRYFELFHFDNFLMISSIKWASLTTTNIALIKSQKCKNLFFQKWCRFEKHIKLKLILEQIPKWTTPNHWSDWTSRKFFQTNNDEILRKCCESSCSLPLRDFKLNFLLHKVKRAEHRVTLVSYFFILIYLSSWY